MPALADPVTGDTVESLRAALVALQRQLAESRAAHAADNEAHDELVAGLRGPCDGCAASLDAAMKATAENDMLRKQIAALEDAATAPAPSKRSGK